MLRQLMEIMLQFFFVTPARRKSGLTKRRSREEGETTRDAASSVACFGCLMFSCVFPVDNWLRLGLCDGTTLAKSFSKKYFRLRQLRPGTHWDLFFNSAWETCVHSVCYFVSVLVCRNMCFDWNSFFFVWVVLLDVLRLILPGPIILLDLPHCLEQDCL